MRDAKLILSKSRQTAGRLHLFDIFRKPIVRETFVEL